MRNPEFFCFTRTSSPSRSHLLGCIGQTSPWFDFFADGSDKIVTPLRETEGYTGNWIGLQTLDNAGRLIQKECNCTHQVRCSQPVSPFPFFPYCTRTVVCSLARGLDVCITSQYLHTDCGMVIVGLSPGRLQVCVRRVHQSPPEQHHFLMCEGLLVLFSLSFNRSLFFGSLASIQYHVRDRELREGAEE